MSNEAQELVRMHWKRIILEYGIGIGNNRKACRAFNINRSTFYKWKKAYDKEEFEGLRRKKPRPYNHPRKVPQETVDKILDLRQTYPISLVQNELYGISSVIMELQFLNPVYHEFLLKTVLTTFLRQPHDELFTQNVMQRKFQDIRFR